MYDDVFDAKFHASSQTYGATKVSAAVEMPQTSLNLLRFLLQRF